VARYATGKQPHYFSARDGSPILTIAGLWDEWTDVETKNPVKSCAMIITTANDFVGEVHDRMPVLEAPGDFDAWLSARAASIAQAPRPRGLLPARRLR
jgi:putative SOS response-associated peptidase YedK